MLALFGVFWDSCFVLWFEGGVGPPWVVDACFEPATCTSKDWPPPFSKASVKSLHFGAEVEPVGSESDGCKRRTKEATGHGVEKRPDSPRRANEIGQESTPLALISNFS